MTIRVKVKRLEKKLEKQKGILQTKADELDDKTKEINERLKKVEKGK